METGFYRHYKGQVYEVLGVARHSETLEELVVYRATYQKSGEELWVRPRRMFEEEVYMNERLIPRFSKL